MMMANDHTALWIYVCSPGSIITQQLQKQRDPQQRILLIHPGAAFTMNQFTLTALDDHTDVLTCAASLRILTQTIGTCLAKGREHTLQLSMEHEINAALPEFAALVASAARTTMDNFSMDASRGIIFMRASLLNLPAMANASVTQLPQLSQNIRAVVCGAGPSLSRHFDVLKTMRTNYVLVAVGHAVPTLLGQGLTPDLVVEDDPRSGMDNWPDDMDTASLTLIAATTVDPTLAPRFTRTAWCQASSPAFNLLAEELTIPLHNMTLYKTVTTHAIDVALRLGCDDVALIGQDFCLSDAGQSHVDHTTLPAGEQLLYTAANAPGKQVQTTLDLNILRQAVQEYMAFVCAQLQSLGRKPRLVNCTEGGARIEGTLRMRLQDFLRRAPTPPQLHVKTRNWPCAVKKIHELAAATQINTSTQSDGSILASWIQETTKRLVHQLQRTHPSLSERDLAAKQQLFAKDLTHVITHDLQDVKHRLSQKNATKPTRNPHVLDCSMKWNLDALSDSHDVLHKQLTSPVPASFPVSVRFRWKNQVIPWMAYLQPQSKEWIAPTGLWSMMDDAQRDNEQFSKASAFDPDRDILVVIAPCNWAHVLQWVQRYPAIRLLVIEPCPHVLSDIMKQGLFMHMLPESTTLCLTPDLCENEYQRMICCVEKAKKDGRKCCCFTPPRTREIPAIDDYFKRISNEVAALWNS